MKIGIFGDSFADQSFHHPPFGWPQLLKDKYETVFFHARSGTSMYRAYTKFLEYYPSYDVVIFCFTNSIRWPVLPKELEGKEWNIGFMRDGTMMERLNPYFFRLFTHEYLQFVNACIFRSVVEECLTHNKYLVNIRPFNKDFEIFENKFPLLTGLDNVSRAEELEIDGVRLNTWSHANKYKRGDHRPCHLNPGNNKIIADWIIDCIDNRKFNEVFDGDKFNNWVINDPLDAEIYKQHNKL